MSRVSFFLCALVIVLQMAVNARNLNGDVVVSRHGRILASRQLLSSDSAETPEPTDSDSDDDSTDSPDGTDSDDSDDDSTDSPDSPDGTDSDDSDDDSTDSPDSPDGTDSDSDDSDSDSTESPDSDSPDATDSDSSSSETTDSSDESSPEETDSDSPDNADRVQRAGAQGDQYGSAAEEDASDSLLDYRMIIAVMTGVISVLMLIIVVGGIVGYKRLQAKSAEKEVRTIELVETAPQDEEMAINTTRA